MKTLRISVLFLGLLALTDAPAFAVILYATDTTAGFYTVDTSNGVVSFVGNHGVSPFIGGLEFNSGGTLYGISAGTAASLYTINPDNGAATQVGTGLGVGFVFEGGLAFDPSSGTLYAVNQAPGGVGIAALMTINTTTGAATVVGTIGPVGTQHDFNGLAFDPAGQLYGLDNFSNALWKIDKNNPIGAGTQQVGAGLGGVIRLGGAGGMTRDESTGIVYGCAGPSFFGGSNHLFTVNLGTGVGTTLHVLNTDINSLAHRAQPTAVEPATWGAIKNFYNH